MRIECAICPYISEDEEDFEKHFMNKHSPVEKSNTLRYRITKENTGIGNKSIKYVSD